MAKQMSDEDILAYKDKDTTAVQARYADWLIDKLELEFPNTKAEAAFREAVRIGTALRMIFQASPENQEAREEARAEREETKPTKKSAKAKAKAEPEPDEDEDEDEETEEDEEVEAPKPKPAKKAAGRPAKSAKAAKAVPAEDDDDTAVASQPKKSAPRKASARSGAAAPF